MTADDRSGLARTGPPGHRGDYQLTDSKPIYGGQGQTFRASLSSARLGADLDGAEVALKQLSSAVGPDADKLLERDHLLRRCRHPSLGRHLEVFLGPAPWIGCQPDEEDCDLLYTASLWVPGESLQQAARDADVDRIIRWIIELAEALDYLHNGLEDAGPVLHRDLHPGNVIVTPDDTATIIDYGLARPATNEPSTSRLLGSPGFVPPERTSGATPGPEADRWQLGMLAVAALLGRPQGVHDIQQVRTDLVDRLRGSVPRPEAFADDLLTMISPDPAQRPTVAQTWANSLGEGRRRSVRHTSRRRLSLTGALVLTVVIALTIITMNRTRNAPDAVAPGVAVDCGKTRCVAFRVVDTIENGQDLGLYVRDCYTDLVCDKRALAAFHDILYGRCRHDDGKNVEGITTWVEVPWRFVPGSVAPDGKAVAVETGKSDPTSPDIGYVSARYLDPFDRAVQLPACA